MLISNQEKGENKRESTDTKKVRNSQESCYLYEISQYSREISSGLLLDAKTSIATRSLNIR